MPDAAAGSVQRIDQWMWFARIAKSRTLAQALIERGKVRINREKIYKTSTTVRPGDVLTLSLGPRVVSIEVLGIGSRRGPASEAQTLYRDLAAPKDAIAAPDEAAGAVEGVEVRQASRPEGSGRPTKQQRRQLDKLRGRS
ncbi:RNA-binding S4 domain-containing protein [Hyphomicrobium sp.]|uniref:RNA-binding S4 domain-containing protein n=1 Tax=Hyphomicrobium sp. TaxID=82 RepID=UPI000FA00415|nr:RNA-binding S4 domain-containing protein [Hyphomicrobium sp.]RUP08538.1 MAG: RNA-binding S4 domain-containing protein [Hyphomicrobium sp.]